MTIWMKVSNDKYELPEVVADSAKELAKILDVNANTIRSSVSHMLHGYVKSSVYRKVEVDE